MRKTEKQIIFRKAYNLSLMSDYDSEVIYDEIEHLIKSLGLMQEYTKEKEEKDKRMYERICIQLGMRERFNGDYILSNIILRLQSTYKMLEQTDRLAAFDEYVEKRGLNEECKRFDKHLRDIIINKK